MSLRWSEQDLEHYLRRGQPAPVSEAAFQSAVMRLAKQYGWMCYHTWSSKRSPEGFPDLVLAHPSPERDTPIIVAELKTDTGTCTPAQQAWLAALGSSTGVVSEIWRPAMLDEIVLKLRGES